jgi:hypothetical protein
MQFLFAEIETKAEDIKRPCTKCKVSLFAKDVKVHPVLGVTFCAVSYFDWMIKLSSLLNVVNYFRNAWTFTNLAHLKLMTMEIQSSAPGVATVESSFIVVNAMMLPSAK